MMNYTHKFMNLDNYFGENLFKIGEKLREKMKRKKNGGRRTKIGPPILEWKSKMHER